MLRLGLIFLAAVFSCTECQLTVDQVSNYVDAVVSEVLELQRQVNQLTAENIDQKYKIEQLEKETELMATQMDENLNQFTGK